MTREDIKINLNKGDGLRIARRCAANGIKTKASYVNFLLREDRPLPKRGKGLQIIKIAQEVALENILETQKANQINENE